MASDDDRNIGRVVEHLMLRDGEKPTDLALILGNSRKTVVRRISGELDWTATEVRLLAQHYRVPVAVLYAGPDALLAGAAVGEGTFHLKSSPGLPSSVAA